MTNRSAFLTMISVSEGTYGKGENGYNVIVGGQLFNSYSDHPRIKVYIPKWGIYSTAAGRYQILARYYDAYKKQLRLPDFSPLSQDQIAWQMITEHGANGDVISGRFDDAVDKVKKIWASLPGAGYGQHENQLGKLKQAYLDAGGYIA